MCNDREGGVTAIGSEVSVAPEGPHGQVAAPDPAGAGRMSRRRYLVLGAALSSTVALVRHWSMAGGWFSADDFVHMTRVTDRPLAEVLPEYNVSGHMNNLSGALDWYLQRLAPYEWQPRVWVVTICVFLTQFLWVAVAGVMVGRRASSLVVVTAVGLTTLSVTALQWWAQAAATAPVQGLTAACVLGFVATASGRSRWWGWLSVGLLALGLIGSERMALTAAMLFVVPFMVGLRGGVREGIRLSVRHWPLLGSVVAVTVAYGVYYLSQSTTGAVRPAVQRVEVVSGIRSILLPVLTGGPLGVAEGAVTAVAATPAWLEAWSAVAVAGLVAYLAYRAPRTLIPVTLFAIVWIGWSVVLVGLRSVLPGVALDWRIYGDLVSWLMLVSLTCAAILVDAPRGRPLSRGAQIFAVAVAVLLVQLHVITLVNATRYWWGNPAEGFASRAIVELAGRPAGSLLDEPLPREVIRGGIITAERRPSVIFGGMPNPPRIDQPTPFPLVLDPTGTPHLAFVDGGTSSLPGPVPGCGWPVSGTVRIPMRGPLFPYNWLMRIGYLAGQDSVGSISSGSTTVDLHFTKGLGEVFLPWRAGLGSSVQFTIPEGGNFCLDAVEVGNVGVGERAP